MLTKTKLASVGNNDIAKFNSLLISFQNSTLRRFLELILGSASSDIIDIMTINTSKFCDIQYTPLIENGDQIIIPVGIAAQSNIVRNLILKTESRIDGDGTRDLIHEKLTASLMTQGISTTTFPYSYNRISGDLDTVFIIGDCLFISENKNQLPGTSLHECQNVIEYYEKAKSQKQKFDTLWTTPGFIKYLEGKIGCSLSGITRYHFFGTFGNRYFSMLSNGDFQLAFIQEITAFIENHPAVIYAQVNGNFSEVERMNWRNPGILTALELSDYINSGREDFAISKTEDIDMIFNQKFIKPSAAFNIAPLDNELDANTNHT